MGNRWFEADPYAFSYLRMLARTYARTWYVSQKVLIYRKGWWNYLGRHPRLIQSLLLGTSDSSLPLIYHPVVQIAPLERPLSVYTPRSIRSSYPHSSTRAKEDVMFIFYDSSSATILRVIDKLKYHSARIIIWPYLLLQIYDDNIAGIVSPSQVYHRSDKHVSLLW